MKGYFPSNTVLYSLEITKMKKYCFFVKKWEVSPTYYFIPLMNMFYSFEFGEIIKNDKV